MSDTQVDEAEEDVSQPTNQETPPQIKTTTDIESFEDISLPNNAEHKALIEVYYKKGFYYVVILFAFLVSGLFAIGVVPVNLAETLATYGTGVIFVLFVIIWLYSNRANS